MKCIVDINDNIVVRNEANPMQMLRLEMSRFYCRLFETTRDQSRDYLDEILRWTDDNLENYDYVSNNLMHFTAARRRYYGFKR
ncbi:MAG: hypothetical protein IKH58_15210 [Bacteroidales bacterium]|jgi:hypothetical protein|nr:hypothetical protein [Bacteroidales bacterium]MBR3540456.1 hypothetical protein [Bacteroidales bacterium]